MGARINSKPSTFSLQRTRSASRRAPPNEARRRSARTLNLILTGPAKPRQIGWDDSLGGLRQDVERAQHASLGFPLRGYDVVRRKQIDLIAGRRQQFGKKPECRLRPELCRGRDPT